MPHVHGEVAPGWEPVATAFATSFRDRDELGAGARVHHRGRVVIDLWGGWTDAARTQAWQRDTIVCAYSTVKPMVATCALLLVDRGVLALDAPVARWWPEFAQAGKDRVTVRQLLAHQAGLIALRDEVPGDEVFDWDAMVERLAAEAPWWEPGTAHGEHAYFYGHLVGELVRRADGRGIRQFFADELAGPWELDYQVGVSVADRERVAPVSGLEVLYPGGTSGPPDSLRSRAVTNPPAMLDPTVVNSTRWMDADIPAVNGHGTAAAVARFYQGILAGGILDGRRLLSEALCREAVTVQMFGRDAYLEEEVSWGLGFQIDDDGPGHGGLGGSVGYCSHDLQLAVGYVTNRMAGHDRSEAVSAAAEEIARSLA